MKPLKEHQFEAYEDEAGRLWIASGSHWYFFSDAPISAIMPFSEELDRDSKALKAFNFMNIFDAVARLEMFIRCRYCGDDNKPDIDELGNHNPEYRACTKRSSCFGCGKICKTPFANHGHLTFHECEVISVMAEDIPDKQVAVRFSLSHHTINNLRRTIQRKLGVYTKTGIAREAVNLGITNKSQNHAKQRNY